MRAEDAQIYRELIAAVRARSAPGSYIYAGPDCPEVYFLSARTNPTRTLYDFFDGSSPERESEILRLIDEHSITIAVIKRGSEFSTDLSDNLMQQLKERFDHLEIFFSGTGSQRRERFRVLWRDAPSVASAG
jgi:hypothetical protein